MEKTIKYKNTKFGVEVLKEATQTIKSHMKQNKEIEKYASLDVTIDDVEWCHDNKDEFFSDYSKDIYGARYNFSSSSFNLTVSYYTVEHSGYSYVRITAPSRAEIENVAAVFEKHKSKSALPNSEEIINKPVIFIGHGRSPQWKDLKNHLQDQHKFPIEAYETGSRAGHTIRDILDDMSEKSSFALLLLTAEDQQEDGTFRARQNVIHETGLFQGKLGFNKAIVLLEHGVETFSNLDGIQYIPYSKGNIKETYGDILATLKREFE